MSQKRFSADKHEQYVHTSAHMNTEEHSFSTFFLRGRKINGLIPFIKKRGRLYVTQLEAPEELQYFLKQPNLELGGRGTLSPFFVACRAVGGGDGGC